LLTGQVVIEELREVLTRKFRVPANSVNNVESLLRDYHVEPKPRNWPDLKRRNDLLLVGSALNANAEILVTGDREILELREKPETIRIVSPRQFWRIRRPGRGGRDNQMRGRFSFVFLM
jgi:predicted nucleic acid-binding protein